MNSPADYDITQNLGCIMAREVHKKKEKRQNLRGERT